MAYEVKLDVFEGPIDLLLHLITRQRVDIYDVSLTTLTREYLAAVTAMGSLDLEGATGFLVIAATLLELKSARLLPRSSDDSEDAGLLEERDLLLARLVECATFRAAGRWIHGTLEDGRSYYPRAAGLEEAFVGLTPDPLAGVGPDRIASVAATVLAPGPSPVLDVSHVAPIIVSVRDALADLAAALRDGSERSFAALCEGQPRVVVIARFLALLELFKAGAVEVAQADRFGDIGATWTGEVELSEVLTDIDEYSTEAS